MALPIEATAPGKLVLAGEYAVLHGAPGLAVAVDVSAEARLEPLAGRGSELLIAESGQRTGFRFVQERGVRWDAGSPGPFGLPLEVCAATLAARDLFLRTGEIQACRVVLSTDDFHQTDARGQRVKLGLGSSAAVVVALMGALLRYVGRSPASRDELLELCSDAHRRLQGGAGSGIDVATSLTGGTIAFTQGAAGGSPHASPLAWPKSLYVVAVWSGRSASTPAMLARLRAFQDRNASLHASHMERLGAIAAHSVSAWRAEDVHGILGSLAAYESALRRLDEAANLGIFSAEHERLRAMAIARGAIYKPSGAGGGDFGVAFTDSRETLRKLRMDFEAAGFGCLDAAFCAPGLHVRDVSSRYGT